FQQRQLLTQSPMNSWSGVIRWRPFFSAKNRLATSFASSLASAAAATACSKPHSRSFAAIDIGNPTATILPPRVACQRHLTARDNLEHWSAPTPPRKTPSLPPPSCTKYRLRGRRKVAFRQCLLL